ncbi:hypothetical protein [Fulvimarina sp. 2208YS6-2-32]|nr:hypothetical protein [Fulvimarina sp. 2208YS6-2-32]
MILYPNRADKAVITGGEWQIPLDRLKAPSPLKRVARSASAALADTQFDIAFDRLQTVKAVALANINFSLAAMWRIRAFDDPEMTVERHNSGWIRVYPRLYSTKSLSWRDPNFWLGGPTSESLEGLTQQAIYLPDPAPFARYWKIEIDDQGNPDGYLDIGRLFMAGGYQPSMNYVYGGGLGLETKTRVDEALGGNEFFDRRKTYRVARIGWDYLPEQEALEKAFDLQRQAGIDREVFLIMKPGDEVNLTRTSFLGRFRQLSPLEQIVYRRASTAFEIKEIQ